MALVTSRALCLLLVSLAVCQAASGSKTSDIQQALKDITAKSETLRASFQSITIVNAPFRGPEIPVGLAAIIRSISEALPGESGGDSLSDDNAKLVVESVKPFVKVHQELLTVVISKHALPTLFQVFPPIRQALVTLEATVDTFTYELVEEIPSQKDAANKLFESLGTTLRKAIDTYSEPSANSELPPLAKGTAVV